MQTSDTAKRAADALQEDPAGNLKLRTANDQLQVISEHALLDAGLSPTPRNLSALVPWGSPQALRYRPLPRAGLK